MPRYYCDYCDTYLTHDSPSVRKQHNAGYKHKANVRTYYQQFDEQQNQSLIDQRIKEHLGQAAAFQHQVGASFNQHLMSLQPGQRPLLPGIRPPILPRPPFGVPGYGPVPMLPQSLAPPGAPTMPMQMGNLPRPPPLMQPVPAGPPNPVMYQTNPSAVATGGYNGFSSAASSGTAPSGAQAAAPGAPAVVVSGAASTSETNH